jgi:hypothetical protein
MNTSITEFLRVNGEKMEAEIAKGLQLPMAAVQTQLAQLSAAGEVICCKVTRYLGGKKVEGTSYRLSRTRSGKPLQQPFAISRK